MKVIWKFPIPNFGKHKIDLPDAAQIVEVGIDPETDRPTLWCEVRPSNNRIERTFRVIATGQAVPEAASFKGTCISPDGLVFHVYEDL